MTKNTVENPPEKMETEVSSEKPATEDLGDSTVDAEDLTPGKDLGVQKVIVQPGVGEKTPCPGDKVFVHYTGKLTNGTVFDSSRDRDVFEFTLGKGDVIKAWDIGVASMKKGEKCILICKPEYAYGFAGSPPKIPPSSTLIFEVELLQWKHEDVTPNKDGGVLKALIKKGEGYSKPNDDATVEVDLIGRYNDTVFEKRVANFSLDEASDHGITKGLEIAIKSMQKNESATFELSPNYAFGKEGKSEFNIPSDANIEYDITLKSFENPKESWNMTSEEKLEQSEFVKNKGTNYFKSGKYDIALKYYKKIIKYLENESDLDEEKDKLKKSLLLAGYLNTAACHLKLEDYIEARKNCDKALNMDPKNIKALFRRGQALMGVKEFEAAKTNFKSVIDLDPSNKAAQQQTAVCTVKVKQILEKEKQTYRNMFEKFAKADAKKTQQNGDSKTEEKDEIKEPESTVEA